MQILFRNFRDTYRIVQKIEDNRVFANKNK